MLTEIYSVATKTGKQNVVLRSPLCPQISAKWRSLQRREGKGKQKKKDTGNRGETKSRYGPQINLLCPIAHNINGISPP